MMVLCRQGLTDRDAHCGWYVSHGILERCTASLIFHISSDARAVALGAVVYSHFGCE